MNVGFLLRLCGEQITEAREELSLEPEFFPNIGVAAHPWLCWHIPPSVPLPHSLHPHLQGPSLTGACGTSQGKGDTGGHHGDNARLWLLLSHPVILQEHLESSAGLEQLSLWALTRASPGMLPGMLCRLWSSSCSLGTSRALPVPPAAGPAPAQLQQPWGFLCCASSSSELWESSPAPVSAVKTRGAPSCTAPQHSSGSGLGS